MPSASPLSPHTPVGKVIRAYKSTPKLHRATRAGMFASLCRSRLGPLGVPCRIKFFNFSLDRNFRTLYSGPMKLTPVSERFILHWGEMGSRWGVNRTVAQIHALLFLAGRPMAADEIAETLSVARSNVSNSLKELQTWRLVRVVHMIGERRDHFETSKDVWELFQLIVEGRRQREVDPTLTALRDFLTSPEVGQEPEETIQRIQETLGFIETMNTWADEMLRLKPETLTKTLGIGARISRAVRGNKA